MNKYQARLKCHHSLWCCQYTDQPMCNGYNDPHRIARLYWRLRHRVTAWKERND